MKSISLSLSVLTGDITIIDSLVTRDTNGCRFSRQPLDDEGRFLCKSDSFDSETQDVVEPLRRLLNNIPITTLVIPGVQLYLNVALMYDTFTCSIQLPPEFIKLLGDIPITIEISCYPTSF